LERITPLELASQGRRKLLDADSGSSSIIGKEKTPGKELNQADSVSSSIKGKEQPPKKRKKEPTPGTHKSPCLQAALSTSDSPSESSLAGVSQPETLDFGVEGASPDDVDAAAENSNVEDENETPENDAVEEGNGVEKLKCSYKKCNNKLSTKEQLVCAVSSCGKKFMLHVFNIICHRLILPLRGIQMYSVVQPRLVVLNSMLEIKVPTTCWDSDGPNGPNTVPKSETV
jgi:hypothetical protein